jgi:hypothetical protein
LASAATVAFAGIEGAWRAWRATPPGVLAGRLDAAVLLTVGVAGAGGLGVLVGGGQPADSLHYLYAVLAFGLVPVSGSLASRSSARVRGVVTFIASAVALVVIARLFATG